MASIGNDSIEFSCCVGDCKKTFKSSAALKFHLEYMHKSVEEKVADKEGNRKKSKMDAFFCPYQNCSRSCQANEVVPFKTYQALRQHYFIHHAEKNLPCSKCHKKFTEVHMRDKHQQNCNIKFVCSCGVAYRGKRGFMSHLSLSKHKCPDALKEYLEQKQKKKSHPKSSTVIYKKRNNLAPILPKGPIPSHATLSGLSQVQHGLNKIGTIYERVPKYCKIQARNDCKKYFIVNVFHPSTESGLVTDKAGDFLHAQNVKQCKIDTVATALLSPGINCGNSNVGISSQPINHTSQPNILNPKTMQIHFSDKLQVAHDSSCQTDEFLAWLDTESAKCNNLEHVSSHMSTQTLHIDTGRVIEHAKVGDLAALPNVTQTETQTDDDWLSNLLQEPDVISSEMLNVECQTPNMLLMGNYNENSNNNNRLHSVEQSSSMANAGKTVFTSLSEYACNMQTQTSFLDTTTDGTTQTGFLQELCSVDDETSSLFNFANDIETQTDIRTNSILCVNSAHTQTALRCNSMLFSDFLNMETQTEP